MQHDAAARLGSDWSSMAPAEEGLFAEDLLRLGREPDLSFLPLRPADCDLADAWLGPDAGELRLAS